MKFIHIADIHLGAKPVQGETREEDRENESWQAFKEVISRARQEQVQILLIAGDLFHRQPLVRELKEVNAQFSTIPQTQVVLIAGNRDYLTAESCYQTFPWGENVHFLKQSHMEYVELEGLDTRVYGFSYWQREITEPMYQDIKVKDGDYCNILLGHGGDEKHIPFRSNDFDKSAFDYVAFGHIHKPVEIVKDKVVMAGALQPVDCSDTGEHGYFQGEIKDHVCKTEFVPLHYCEYVPLILKVSPEITQSALQEYVLSRIRVAPKYQKFRITLKGFCDEEHPVDANQLRSMEQVVQVTDRCCADYDFEKLKLQYGQQILGRYIRTLEEMPQNEVTKKALYYGVEALMAE
ncbi:MAG: DNA repair exonuclease [Lachnospiraceae bacterium]|nr:DNA repair exonuclease [Lachnospiraceae bacterium]